MSASGVSANLATPASILVVDDDRRVVELLTIALTAYGFRVIQAGDGDEALRVAAREHPDLVVLDVRLPKRSGFEVCEQLRKDPDDPQVPIILVSAAAETEARLQGLGRGADDFVAKPFSPKELIARIKRLLARSAESRDAHRRGRQFEHELLQAREEARRSHAELREQQRLRELAHAFMHGFHGHSDLERLTRRLLLEAQAHLGSSLVALLVADEDGVFRTHAVRGDAFERAGRLAVRPGGELEPLLAGLGRPVRHRELQRFPGLLGELEPFVVAGVVAFAPLRGPAGLEAILVADERHDGLDLGRQDLEVVAVLCDTASLAIRNARRCAAQAEGLLDALEAMAARDLGQERWAVRCEAGDRVAAAIPGWPRPARERVARAVRLGAWVGEAAGAGALRAMVERDTSGRLRSVAELLEPRGLDSAVAAPEDQDEADALAPALVAVGLDYAAERERGAGSEAAVAAALAPRVSLLPESLRAALLERTDAFPKATGASRYR